MQKCLIPGGFLLLTDADFDFCTYVKSSAGIYRLVPQLKPLFTDGPDTQSYFPVGSDSNPTGSWFARIIAEFERAVSKFGGDLKGTAQALDEGLWDAPMMDPAT
jgi:hypothetical protein